MSDTHDYNTKKVLGKNLTNEHVLVGESGGLSAIYELEPSSAMPGFMRVETEHGPLYLDPDHEYDVLAEGESHGSQLPRGAADQGGLMERYYEQIVVDLARLDGAEEGEGDS